MFKVGDRVRIIKNTTTHKIYDKHNGREVTISKINGRNEDYPIYFKEEDVSMCCKEEELELVKDNSEHKFKVGDLVETRENRDILRINKVYEVSEINKYMIRLIEEPTSLYNENLFELVKVKGGENNMGLKYIYECIVVDKKKSEVILEQNIIAKTRENCIFELGRQMDNKIKVDNLSITIQEKGSFEKTEIKECIIKKETKE